MVKIIFITRDNTGANKLRQSFTPKMPETTMPKGSGSNEGTVIIGGKTTNGN